MVKSERLLLDIVSALGSSGLSPQRLELEITETVMLHDTETTLAMLLERTFLLRAPDEYSRELTRPLPLASCGLAFHTNSYGRGAGGGCAND
jgi:hypothetical protein